MKFVQVFSLRFSTPALNWARALRTEEGEGLGTRLDPRSSAPFFHPRIKLRARIAHGGGRRPGNEARLAIL